MKKILVFSLILAISGVGFLFTSTNTAYALHDERPLCYLVFWRDNRCDNNNDSTETTVNQAPIWNNGQTGFSVKSKQFLQFTVSAYDPNGDALTYAASYLPIGASFNAGFGTFTWTPESYQWGTYGIQFSAYDGKAHIYQTITVLVQQDGGSNTGASGGNNKPQWSTIGNQSVFVGHVLQFSISATDPDGDSISYSAMNLPNGATFEGSSRTFSWTPQDTQIGTHVVTFQAGDGRLTSDMGVIIRVSKSNNKPSFVNFVPPGTGRVGQLYNYDVNSVDFDNDPLVYSLPSAPTGMTIHDSTGMILWTPGPTQAGFNYTQIAVSDGKSQTTQGFYIFVDATGVVATPTPLPPVTPGPSVPQNPAEVKITFSDIKFEIADGEIYVNWKTNIPSGSRVIWGTASQAEKTRNFTYENATADNRELVSNHRVLIGKLETGTVHYLRLVSKTDRQSAVSQEIAFVELGEGRIASIFGASLFGILGDLFGNATFLWLLIAALAFSTFVFYRKHQKNSLPL